MVVNMRRPCQGDHHVYIKQTDHYSSSSALRTSSNVMGCAPVGTEKTGNPEPWGFRRTRGVAVRPRRARSDIAFPRDSDFACARLLAAAIRSSSIVNVVLMMPLYTKRNGDVKMFVHHDVIFLRRTLQIRVLRGYAQILCISWFCNLYSVQPRWALNLRAISSIDIWIPASF